MPYFFPTLYRWKAAVRLCHKVIKKKRMLGKSPFVIKTYCFYLHCVCRAKVMGFLAWWCKAKLFYS